MSTASAAVPFRQALAFLPRVALVGLLSLSTLAIADEQGKEDSKAKGNDAANSGEAVHTEVGEASWYGPGFQGEKTASGEKFDQNKMTAAHPTLPLGSEAEVTNLETGKKAEVEINDRGPYEDGRVIDLSKAAAEKLDMKEDGTAKVKIEATPAPDNDAGGKADNKQSDDKSGDKSADKSADKSEERTSKRE